MRQVYQSDISREQFAHILPILENARKTTRPRTIDLYEIFCALLYLLKSGCQWRMIPNDFPKWKTVYSYFQIWSLPQRNGPSILEQALKKSSIRSPKTGWAKRQNEFYHRRRTEC